MASDYELSPQGDRALIVRFGQVIDLHIHRKVMALDHYLTTHPQPGINECVPSYTTLTIFYQPHQLLLSSINDEKQGSPYEVLCSHVKKIIEQEVVNLEVTQPRVVEIPVCYGGEYGPDLIHVAEHAGLCPEEVIEIHTAPDYLIYMLGFSPGFPYLGGMSERIATPRRATPRGRVPAGSVGIGGKQTGIYSIETPGGWQLIGRTPATLFNAALSPPTLLGAGDLVRFRSISIAEFNSLQKAGQ